MKGRIGEASRRKEEPKRGVAYIDSLALPKGCASAAIKRINNRMKRSGKFTIKYLKEVNRK